MAVQPGRFEALGLDEATARAFEALAADERCTGSVESVATCAGLSRAKATHALAALVELGLANRQVEDGRFAANPVEAALGALVAARREELARAEAASRQLALRAARRQQRLVPEQLVSIVQGARQIRVVQEQLLRSAHGVIRTFDRPPYVTPGAQAAPGQVDSMQPEILARGVEFHTIYDAALLEQPELLARLQREIASGERGRVMANLPLKLMVADESLALLPLLDADDDREPAALLIRPSVLLDSLVTLFEALWRAATPLVLTDAGLAVETGEAAARRVVELLAGGLTEQRLARVLGVSDRTVRRRLADIRDALGASTMFQAGVAAARKGWV